MNAANPFVDWVVGWARAVRFAALALATAMSPSAYRAETRDVALKQIYFTAWQVLPGFLLFSTLASFVVIEISVNAARGYGLAAYALELVMRGLVLELIPLVTALFVALRSGAAIATEIGLMKASGELERMLATGVDTLEREFVPRVAAAAVSVLSLTVMSCTIAMALAYFVMYGASPHGFADFTRVVALVFGRAALLGFLLKCIAFGALVAVIPIAAGLHASTRLKSVPVVVLDGMVRLFFALGAVEVLALAVKYT
jgi:phospholipid/cholesterol/gamma-HCH transport system permease protein